MTASAVRIDTNERIRRAEGLALIVRRFLAMRTPPPCSVCRGNDGVLCALCRLHNDAVGALGDWERK